MARVTVVNFSINFPICNTNMNIAAILFPTRAFVCAASAWINLIKAIALLNFRQTLCPLSTLVLSHFRQRKMLAPAPLTRFLYRINI